jgi:hypothetical protein
LQYIRPSCYTATKEIYNAKSIDNYFGKNPTAKKLEVKTLVLLQEIIKHRSTTTKDKFVDEKLVQICKSIAHLPKFQNQLMQIVLQLDPDILIEAQKIKFQYVILLEFTDH